MEHQTQKPLRGGLTPLIGHEEKALSQNIKELSELTSFFERRQLCIELNSFMVVEMDVAINERRSFIDSF